MKNKVKNNIFNYKIYFSINLFCGLIKLIIFVEIITMKTAMQELIFHIAYMERRKYQDEQTQIIGGMNECIMNDAIVIQNRIIEELTKEYAEYLEKENEQIKDAWNAGMSEGIGTMMADLDYDGEFINYYNETYNQNK